MMSGRNHPCRTIALLAAAVALALAATAQKVPVVNPSFEEGADGPTGWTLSGGQGGWISEAADGHRAVAVTGGGGAGENNYWRSDPVPLEPNTLYMLQFQARQVSGSGGCPTSGPVFCNRDLGGLSEDWTAFRSIFLTPAKANPAELWIRFGQWEVNGTVAYDAVSLTRAEPVYRVRDGIALGEGETITGNRYCFRAPFDSSGLNFSRPLDHHQCHFNKPRWVFGANSEVVYRHVVGDLVQTSAELNATVNLYSGGQLVIEASADGQTWRHVDDVSEQAQPSAPLPPELFPTKEIWIRLRSEATRKVGDDSDPGSFQINAYQYQATFEQVHPDIIGRTNFIAVSGPNPSVDVAILTLGDAVPGGENVIVAQIHNKTGKTVTVHPRLEMTCGAGEPFVSTTIAELAPGPNEVRLAYEIPLTGTVHAVFTLGKAVDYEAETSFQISDLYSSYYGELLPASSEDANLWWASSGWKISQSRPAPTARGKAVRIATARNEAEAAQVVVRPANAMTGFLAKSTALQGPGGATIPAECIEVLRVRYVPVEFPTDDVGVAAPWPDPLPPFRNPIQLDAGRNQPLWIRVTAPRNAVPGLYTGAIQMIADGYAAEVPIEVTVFDFDLPDRMTCTTAFGFDPTLAFRYHNVTDPDHKRAVFDKYLAALSRHHISPYDPAALDPFDVTWPKQGSWSDAKRDTAEKHGGEGALLVRDESTTNGASSVYDELIEIPEKGLNLRFWYKTAEAGHAFIVTLLHHDAGKQWMYGQNNDIRIDGNGEWQLFERTLDQFPEGARYFLPRLWAALYAEDGSTTGTVWYDDLLIANAGTGHVLIEDGFEPLGSDPASLRPAFNWNAWDRAMERAIDTYHFNTFAVPIQGMGGGTFHARHEPSLLGYSEDTPHYKTAFSNYCQGLQEHLREKGWLDDAFVYWFDEPDPKDYEFVMNGFRKLKEAAPDIGRMLTEQVEPELAGGPNIWCPLTPAWNKEQDAERRAEGDIFWWYICCGPKAPYATLFIDHPATELRVWLWQTWKRRIDGLLIWQTNYWTSDVAYPDAGRPQNPYQDPMGWVTGYSTPSGLRIPWGNGDGRFIYPPEAAADGCPAQPVLDDPVDSIRFEMLRDGIEDFEYMAMLDRLARAIPEPERAPYATLLVVPDAVSRDLTHFTKDPAPIEAHREAVARAIETLSKR